MTFTADVTRQRIAPELPVELLRRGPLRPRRKQARAQLGRAPCHRGRDAVRPAVAGPLIRATPAADDRGGAPPLPDRPSRGLRRLVERHAAAPSRRDVHRGATGHRSPRSPAMQLSEYVDWFDRYLSSEDRGEDEHFWAARVTQDFPTTELPADNPRTTRKTYRRPPAGAAPRPRAGRRPSRAGGGRGHDAVRPAARRRSSACSRG